MLSAFLFFDWDFLPFLFGVQGPLFPPLDSRLDALRSFLGDCFLFLLLFAPCLPALFFFPDFPPAMVDRYSLRSMICGSTRSAPLLTRVVGRRRLTRMDWRREWDVRTNLTCYELMEVLKLQFNATAPMRVGNGLITAPPLDPWPPRPQVQHAECFSLSKR